MHTRLTRAVLPVLLFFILSSCQSEVSRDKIRKVSTKALDLSQEYVDNKHKEYLKELDNRIDALGHDIDKLRDVSEQGKREAGNTITSGVDQLSNEKLRLESMRKALLDKTDSVKSSLQLNWNRYNNEQDSLLNGFDNFLQPYPLTGKEEKK